MRITSGNMKRTQWISWPRRRTTGDDGNTMTTPGPQLLKMATKNSIVERENLRPNRRTRSSSLFAVLLSLRMKTEGNSI